jgi:hypothetical protein
MRPCRPLAVLALFLAAARVPLDDDGIGLGTADAVIGLTLNFVLE